MNRRGFLAGLVSVLAAPALVHASNLMPLRGSPLLTDWGTVLTTIDINNALISFRKEMTREYIRQNLFSPSRGIFDEPWRTRLGATEAEG